MAIRDIAEHFNISVSMVSRAVNNSGYVRRELREAVQAYARAHHWQPSRAAAALKNRRNRLRNEAGSDRIQPSSIHSPGRVLPLIPASSKAAISSVSALGTGGTPVAKNSSTAAVKFSK